MASEVRTVRRVDEYHVYFYETSGLSIARSWFPGVKVGQKWAVVIDYTEAVVGKVISTELIEEVE